MGWEKKSGLLPGEPDGVEINDSQRLDLFFSWTPIDRVTLTLDLPFAFNQITEIEDGMEDTSSLSGFSDMSLTRPGVHWTLPPPMKAVLVMPFLFVRCARSSEGERSPSI